MSDKDGKNQKCDNIFNMRCRSKCTINCITAGFIGTSCFNLNT